MFLVRSGIYQKTWFELSVFIYNPKDFGDISDDFGQVAVAMLAGMQHKFYVCFVDPVFTLMAYIKMDIGIDIKHQTLYFGGVKLHRQQIMRSLGITDGAVLNLDIDMEGGGKRGRAADNVEVLHL